MEKQCPYCAETINADAKKCRFCGEFFDVQTKKEAKKGDTSGLMLTLIILAIAALLITVFGL